MAALIAGVFPRRFPMLLGSRLAVLACSLALSLSLALVPEAVRAAEPDLKGMTERELPSLVKLYQELHAAPELSRLEAKTSARLAQELRDAGYDVTERVGKYFVKSWTGYGVVAVMKNGPGPTLLVRADMDALPVEEKTGLPYASKVRMKNEAGVEMPVMHACGHDIHVASLVGVARLMARMKDRWSGTLLLIGQPAEETIDGAAAMLNDGLYQRFGKPDYAIALHDFSDLPAGQVGVTPGYALATSTQMDVIVRGVGGHGSKPEGAKDPIVLAANIVMQLQTIVSREISPFDQAVLTVGTIHGGTKRNIIPDEVKLELNLRAYKEEVRQRMVQSVARIVRAAALGAGMPEDRLPIVNVIETEFAPAMYNDPDLTERLTGVFQRALGMENVLAVPPVMGSEDFPRFGLEAKVPAMFWRIGMIDPEEFREAQRTGRQLPSAHSPYFAPVPEPTIRTGVVSMTAAALDLLGRGAKR
jgi:hippurate hydrolase